MSVYDEAFVNSELSKPTSIFGLKLWVVIGIFVGSTIVLLLFLLSLCLTSRRSHSSNNGKLVSHSSAHNADVTPPISKEIQEIVPPVHHNHHHHRPINPEIQIDIGKPDHRVVFSDKAPSSGESLRSSNVPNHNNNNNNNYYGSDTHSNHNYHSSNNNSGSQHNTSSYGGPEVSHLGWGRWYTLRELEMATNCLADENVIGEGGYGIVYHGVAIILRLLLRISLITGTPNEAWEANNNNLMDSS